MNDYSVTLLLVIFCCCLNPLRGSKIPPSEDEQKEAADERILPSIPLVPAIEPIPEGPSDVRQICLSPAESGRGPFKHVRYHFNSEIDYCDPFTYNGYGSNGNNFCSREECFSYCTRLIFFPLRASSSEQSPALHLPSTYDCSEPYDSGNGFFYSTRYYYDPILSQCAPFIYYGSGGNLNNFCSREECMTSCAVLSPFQK
ncbi:kunitz-type serine protease inhibitor A-like [Oratosquilla oratoria]|uniref:kunitz-type serine protease inhibitor A-like n=1 Tax=Oratosquilla oratoria TaxID=337810 RepID=UPI003F762E8F